MLGANLCITILTGRRLGLLRRTLESLDRVDRSILEGSYVVVYVNGRDDETARYLDGLPFVSRLEYHPHPIPEPIGDAVSRLTTWIPSRCRYNLHLEDDWACEAKDAQFLIDAALVLETDTRVGQVRLRLASERVSSSHMLTGRPSLWREREAHGLPYRFSGLHYTFNPSLQRVVDLGRIYPADHENTAAAHYMRIFPQVAQLVPGAFKHIGEEGPGSLRVKLGRA